MIYYTMNLYFLIYIYDTMLKYEYSDRVRVFLKKDS